MRRGELPLYSIDAVPRLLELSRVIAGSVPGTSLVEKAAPQRSAERVSIGELLASLGPADGGYRNG